MAEQVNVTSIDAIEDFRTSLIVFHEKARQSLSEASEGVVRARQWVQVEQRTRWAGEFKRRSRRLDEARAELYSAELSTMTKPSARLKQNVAKAERALTEVEDKMRLVKKWGIAFDQQVAPRAKKLEGLQGIVDQELPKAIAYLAASVEALSAYAEAAPATSTTRTDLEEAADESTEGGEEVDTNEGGES